MTSRADDDPRGLEIGARRLAAHAGRGGRFGNELAGDGVDHHYGIIRHAGVGNSRDERLRLRRAYANGLELVARPLVADVEMRDRQRAPSGGELLQRRFEQRPDLLLPWQRDRRGHRDRRTRDHRLRAASLFHEGTKV